MCSRDVKVAGLLGSAASLEAKSSAVAEQQVGLGGTTKWRLASLVSHATITYSFTAVDGCLVVYAMGLSIHHRLAEGQFCHNLSASCHCNQYFVCTFFCSTRTQALYRLLHVRNPAGTYMFTD